MHRIALLIAFVLVATPSVAQEPWWDEIEVREWILAGEQDDSLIFTREAGVPPGQNYARLWVRTEYESANPGDPISTRALIEFDCTEWRSRRLAMDGFAEHNLGGNIVESSLQRTDWIYIAPETTGDALTRRACQ